jgi:hypothetical protein
VDLTDSFQVTVDVIEVGEVTHGGVLVIGTAKNSVQEEEFPRGGGCLLAHNIQDWDNHEDWVEGCDEV